MPDLTGIRITLDHKVCCLPNAIIARAADGEYELRCAQCSARKGELPEQVASFIQDLVRVFGTPTAPIFLSRATTKERTEMNRDAVFPSRFFKAADLTKPIAAKVEAAQMITLKNMQGENEQKLALSFAETNKQLVVNRTNYDALAGEFGDDTNSWLGKTIELYATKTRIGPKLVDCVRVRTVNGAA